MSSQDTAPQDLAFNTDGTKMFVVGSAGDAVNEYTLSTGFDVSTATFVHSFSVSSLDTAPQGLAFNTDGTKMFVLGNSGIDVNEYTLSTGFDVSTASFVDSFSVSSQETNPLGLAFNTDGTKMFVSGTSGADVNEYTLSTGFDVSTATFVDSFSVSSQDIAPYGLAFNTDGTKMFVVGTIGDDVNEYTLSTGFDVSTASFVDSFSVSSQEAVPVGLAFNTDGTKMFVVGHEGDDVTEYSLTTPFSLVNVSGEHSGDVINTSSTDNYDTDPDGDTLTVTTYSHTSATDEDGGSISSTSSTGTAGTNNVTGYYGTLDLEGDGSYTYTADLTATQALDPGDTVTDVFTYTVDDGNGETDTATITITVNGMNDAPTAVADTDSVDAGSTVTDEDGAGTLVSDDTDPDASSSLYVTKITGNGNTSNVTYNSTKISNAATIVGSKGTLTFGSDGSYSYAADSDATSGDDVFTYTLTDGTSTSTATLTISVTEVANNAPTITAQTDVAGAVTEITDGASGEGTNNLTDTGSFTIADLDNDSVSVSTAEGTTDAVGGSFLGALTATVADDTDDGSGQINWTYTVADADVEYLEAGETVTETFTVTVSDGNGGTVDQTVTVVITGANDAPTLTTGAVDVAVNEASDASAQDLSSSGTITFADLDETTSITAATSTVTGSSGVSIPSAVNTALLSAITVTDNSDNTAGWTLSATDLDLDFLTAGQTITLEKVVTATDGQSATVTDTITVTITGTNDAPTLTTGAVDVAVNEASDASAQDLSSSGTITFADLDETTSITAATSTVTGSSGVSIPSAVNTALLSAITVTDNSDNTAGWTLSATDLDLDFLTAGQTITLEKVVTATDGQSATVTDTITVTITGTNDAPTLTTGAVDVAVNEASDASAQDLSSSGTITFADLDETTSITAATSTVTGSSGVSIPSAVNTALLSAITVTDNSDNTAGWTLSATDLDLDFLTAGQTITLEKVVTATDGQSATVTDTITVTITGTNDAPTITAQTDVAGAVTEITDGASGEGTNNLTDTGSFTIADLDNDSVSVSTAEGTTDAVGGSFLGALTATVADDTDDGSGQINWTYTVADADVEYLEAGETVTETFTVTVSDGNGGTVDQTVTVVITGANDTPTLTTGAVDVAVNEASDASAQDLSSSGTITFADLDETTSITAATSTVTGSSGVSIPSAVNTALLSAITVTDNSDNTAGWTLSATDLDLDFLTAGQTITLEKVVTATDGQSATVTDTITVTITGTNDAPTLTTGAVDVAVNEASDASAQDLSSSGTITFADLDETTSITAATSTVTGSSGVSIPSAVNTALLSAITVTDNSDNTAGWTLSATDLDLDFLTAGQTITLEKVVTATDGQSATVTDTITVTITGTNDAPTLTTGAVDVAVNEASDASAQDLSSSGTITFADLDETTSITAATSTVTGSSGVSIPSAVNTALLSAITVTDNSDNTAGWTLSATDLDLDFLTAGQTITLEKVVTATDGQSATVTDTITVTITGTNDAPTLTTGAVDVAVNEASDASAQDLSSSGTITFADLDETTSITAATSTVTGSSGVSIPSAVNTALLSAITVTDNSDNTAGWTLSATDLDLDFLTAGQTITLEKVVTATDGQSATVTDTITVTITGTNDAPTLTTGAVDVAVNEASDASAQDLSSSGTITFADLDETTSITAATSTVTGSSGVSIPSAVNTALLSAITVTDNSDNTAGWTLSATDLDLDFLTAGQTITLEKVVTATDGQSATVTDTITVTITGTNDAPTITAQTDVAGAVTEITDGASGEGTNNLTDTGSFTIADLDNDSVSVSTAEGTTDAVGGSFLGALTATVADDTDDGSGQINWTYTVADADVEYLEAGETVTETFTVTVSDGNGGTVDQTVTVVITGANDTPTLTTGAVDVAVNEASDASAQDLSSSGTITFADLDETTSITAATSTVTGSSGVSIPSAVNTALLSAITVTDNSDNTAGWTLSATDLDLDFLTAGQTITLEKVVTATDGQSATVTDTITVTITGTNDAPTLTTGAVDVDVNEASDASAQDLSSSGTITFADLDETTSITAATSTVTGSSGVSIPSAVNTALLSAITVTDNSDNTAGWTLSATDLDLDFLTAGQTITLEKVVTATDGQSATVTDTITVTITGTNDAPTLTTGAVDVDVNEASDASAQDLSSSGTITFADLDETTSITAATSTVTGSSGVSIPSAVNTALLSAITVTDNSDNTAGWTLSATDLDLDFLTAGQTITLEKVVTATDGQSATVTDTITVTITGTNDAPVANVDTINVTVGTPATGNVITSSDTDPDGDSLTVSAIAGGSVGSAVTGTYGTFTLNSDGSYTYTVDTTNSDVIAWQSGDAVLTETFTYTVSDGTATDTATITVNASGQNDAPTANDDTINVTVGTPATGNVITSSDTDPDSDSLTVSAIAGGSVGSAVTGTYGTFTLNSDGSYTYTVDTTNSDVIAWQSGDAVLTETFTYTVSDGNGGTDTATITVNASGQNDAPTANDDTINVTVGTPATGNVITSSDTDPDGDSLTVSAIAGGSVGSAVTGTYGTFTLNSDGSYTYTVDTTNSDVIAWQSGDAVLTETFTYTVSDGNGGTDTATITVNASGQNDAPTAADNTVTTNEDTNHTFAASEFNFTDVDGDSLDHISIETLPSNGTLLLSGNAVSAGDQISVANISNLVFRPVANANGDDYDTFTFSVNDGTVDSGTYTMTIDVTAVNDAPLATDDADAVNEDATITESSGSELLVADDTDTDGNTLTVTQIAITGGSNSSVTSSTTYSNGTSITGTYGTLTVGANGSYTYVADQSASDDLDASDLATDSFTYTISDGTTTDTATLIITVTGINDVPTASDNTVSTAEDNPYVFSTSDFGFTDADDDDALVSIKITTLEDCMGLYNIIMVVAWVDVTLNQVITSSDITSGYLRLNPAASENGSPYTTFNFTVNDGDADSATPNTITVNVTSVNDAPVAQDDIGTVNEDATTTVSSASSGVIDDNDTDAESDTLIITNIAHTNGNTEGVTANTTYSNGQSIVGTYGTLTIGANGTYAYVADQDVSDALDLNDQVTDVFTYTISDGNGGTDTATITITVTGVNDAPTSTGGTITTNEDENYILSVSDFNFSDPDDSGSLNKVKITTLETNGNLEYYNGTAWVAVTLNQEINASDITSGYLRFRPDANENGSSYTTFGYQVSDGTVYSSATTMTVNVTAVNDAPVATDDASSVTEDSNVRVRASEDDLLNDDSDTESDSLSVTLIKPLNGSNTSISSGSSTTITGTYGQLTVKSNGAYNYKANQDAADTLDTGESAEEQFVYTVSDGNGGTDTGILTITINGIEDDPNAVKDNISLNISESLTLTGNATTNDIDPDDSLTIVACGQGRNPNVGTAKTVGTAFDSNYGQMTINTDGSYTFVAVSNIKELLEPGQSVTEKFYYTVSDGNSTSTAMIEVTVQRDNVVNELSKKEQKQIKKQISKDRVNQPSTIRLEKIPTIAKPFEQSASALDNLSNLNRISFNEGIKLVDLVAQTGSFKTTDGSLDKVQAKQKNGQLNLQFKVSAELGNEIVKYEAVMPDGSKIPDWIKVDPKTGETITEIPEEIELVDFIIIATDKQNNKKEISVSIDPKEIKEDKSIFKKAKKQNASISVDQNGNVNIVNTNESGDVNQAETKNINANDKQNSDNNIKALESNFDNANSIRKIIETIKSEQVYQLQTINNGEVLETKVPETLIGNFEKTKLVLKDGSAIPDWVEFDPVTGEISVNLPNDIDKLEFKLIVESDGKIIVSDLEIDVRGDEVAQNLQDIENTRFIAFKDQLNKEHDNWEEYGSNIINRL